MIPEKQDTIGKKTSKENFNVVEYMNSNIKEQKFDRITILQRKLAKEALREVQRTLYGPNKDLSTSV